MSDIENLKTEIALLKKDAKTGELIHQRLEIAIDKLSEIVISCKQMLAQQEQKLQKAEQTDDDIFVTLESRRKEWDNDLKDLHSRISTQARELRDNQYHLESKLLNEIRMVRTQLSERVGVLEKWRWLIIGGAIVVGFALQKMPIWG